MNEDDSYDLFISYAQEDRSWVEGYLLDALKTAGVNVHTERAFILGQPRLNEFERAVNRCRRVLLVITPAYAMDDNIAFVDLLAQQFGLDTSTWPVIPLYLKPTTNLPTRISMLTGLDAKDPDDWDEVIRRLCTELEYPAPAIPPRPPCPYPGMVPFATADSHRFYGRDPEIQEMLERLRLHPFLTIIGASGSGKSSLVFAGLVPALQASGLFGPENGREGWLIRDMRPGADPGTALTQALDGDSSDAAGLATQHNAARLLLIVDQFEELFTLGSAQADAFQRTLLELIATPQVYVVLAVRADFFGDLIDGPLWPQIKAHRLEVTPLGKEQLEAAIVKPAESVQVLVETALVERLMADAAQEPGVLPLLQETLRLLWEKVERRYLAVGAYTDMAERGRNGLQIAMDRRANVVYNNLPAEDQPLARRIFLRLIQFGEGRADTRRQVAEDDLRAKDDDPTRFASTLQTLIDHRLLTASGGEGETARRVDIAHEALISGWALLRGWVDVRRTAEQTRRRLETTARRWEELDRAGGLLDPVELAEAQRWLAQPDGGEVGGASDSLAGLIEASTARIRENEEAKVAAQKREVTHAVEQAQARRRTFLLAAALLIAVFVVVAVGTFWQKSRISEAGAVAARSTAEVAATAEATARSAAEVEARAAATSEAAAQEQRRLAESAATKAEAARRAARAGELAGQALAELDLDANGSKALALLLAREAVLTTWKDDGYITDAAMSALNKSVRESSPWLMDLTARWPDSISSVAWSPQGDRILTGSDLGTAKVWDAQTGQELIFLTGHAGSVTSVAWSPQGNHLLTGSDDKTAKVWDAQTGQELLTLTGHAGSVMSVAWSHQGDRLLTGSDDNTVKAWDAQTGQELLTLTGHASPVNSVAWSPEGDRLLTGSNNGTAKVWEAQTGQELLTLTGHTGSINSVAWSPQGDRIITGSNDNTAKVWDARSGQELLTLSNHAGSVTAVDWSPQGDRILTGSLDNTAKAWDAQNGQELFTLTGQELFTLTGHANRVLSVAWSPQGDRILTSSNTNTAKVWDAQIGQELLTLADHTGSVMSVAWSPRGDSVFTGSKYNIARVWNARTGQELLSLINPGWVLAVTWSPQGDRLLTGSFDNTAKLWDAKTGHEILTLTGHVGSVRSVAWSPHGDRLITGSDDNTAKVWDAQSGQELFTLIGHAGPVSSVSWSPQGDHLLTGSFDNTAKLWNAKTGQELLTLTGHVESIRSVAWSPWGDRLITGSDDSTAKVWNAQSGQELLTLVGHSGSVWSVAWSPQGDHLLTGSLDHTAKVWDAQNGQKLLTLADHSRSVYSVAWSPHGDHILSGSDDKTAKIWLMPDALLEVALRKVQRNPPVFTPEEKARYGIDD